MAKAQYFIVHHEGGWKIQYEDRYLARYGSQIDAIRDAIAAARKVGNRGRDAQVLVQDDDCRFRTWTYYGDDPYR